MEHGIKIGIGYDVHRLVVGRPLILGGVAIPYERGLLGHSDADVLVHAIIDALLGAAGMGDIGRHFPDTDPTYSGADSLGLLAETAAMLAAKGFRIGNIDSVIIAERPRMSPYIAQMEANIAAAAGILASQVNVKATTEEGLGFSGRGEGMAAKAVCILEARSRR